MNHTTTQHPRQSTAQGMRSRKLFRRSRHARPMPVNDGGLAVAPDAITVYPRSLDVGGGWVATFAVTGYPREVLPGWLSQLVAHSGRVDVSLHISPVDPVTAANTLQRQLAKLESGRRSTAEHGRLFDPAVEAATADAYDLADRVARGEGRLFRLGLYFTVHADSEESLAEEVSTIRALAASVLLDAKPATYRPVQGWISTLPLAMDQLGLTRTFDTAALASAFPFNSPDLPNPDPASAKPPPGVLYGYNATSTGLLFWDRFSPHLDNHNAVVLGRSGAGKSYLLKLELLRSLYRGVEAFVVDPENEYETLCDSIGGTYIHLGGGARLNPFDVPANLFTADSDRPIMHQTLFLHSVIDALTGGLDATSHAVLDQSIGQTYRAAGFTDNPHTWTRPAPLLRDLRDQLESMNNPVAQAIAAQLHPYTSGAYRDLFDGHTTVEPDGHLVVFSLRDVPREMKSVASLLTLNVIWRRIAVTAGRRPRLVLVDEAWLLMKIPAGAEFLEKMARAARKLWAGLTIATQDIADLLGNELGMTIVSNATTQILLRQSSQAIHSVAQSFSLTDGERQLVLTAARGTGLLISGQDRAIFHAVASEHEDSICTSSPAQLATNLPGERQSRYSAAVYSVEEDAAGSDWR